MAANAQKAVLVIVLLLLLMELAEIFQSELWWRRLQWFNRCIGGNGGNGAQFQPVFVAAAVLRFERSE